MAIKSEGRDPGQLSDLCKKISGRFHRRMAGDDRLEKIERTIVTLWNQVDEWHGGIRADAEHEIALRKAKVKIAKAKVPSPAVAEQIEE